MPNMYMQFLITIKLVTVLLYMIRYILSNRTRIVFPFIIDWRILSVTMRGDIFTLHQALNAFSSPLNDIASEFLRMSKSFHRKTCNRAYTTVHLLRISFLSNKPVLSNRGLHVVTASIIKNHNVAIETPKEKYGGKWRRGALLNRYEGSYTLQNDRSVS